MTERYVQLSEDLQYAKRETATWRQKYSQADTEIQGLNEQIRELRRSVQSLQEANNKLTFANRQLNEDKESIMSGYSTEISMIKEEIASKQQEIAELKDVASPAKIDQQIAIRQLKYDLHEEFSSQTAAKEKKIQEISALLDRASYQREIEREKSKLKIQNLQDNLRELQLRHENEILQYTNRLYQQIQNRPTEDKDYLRRLKRENEQLRKKMELSQSELTQILEEKNQVTKDYTKWMNEYKKYISDHQAENQVYKVEVQRLAEQLQQQSTKKDELTLKDREREIKRLKNELEELRDDIIFKEKKIADFELERVRLLNEIKISKSERERAGDAIEETLKDERDKLMRDLNEAKVGMERLRTQNVELHDKMYDITRLNVENKKRWDETLVKNEEQDLKNRLKRQRSEQILPTIPTVQKADKSVEVTKNEDAVAIQKTKVKEILAKYLEAKQRIVQLEKKLKKANDKIVELLQHKIILGSPKATTKKFEFPTEPQEAYHAHPQKMYADTNSKQRRHVHMASNESTQKSPSPNKYQTHTVNEIKSRQKDNHAFTSTNLRRDFFSPQDDRLIRIEDEEPNECSYYQKSLKLKNQKFRELKCSNHENQ